MVRQNGYYIYYERNPMMQDYLVERNQKIREAQSYENMLEAKRDEKVIRQFREKISKTAKANNRRGMLRKVTSAAAAAMVVVVGGSVYYYAKNDTTVNLRDMVRGAVQTMGNGVKNQISSDEDSEIPATLETEAETEETTEEKAETTAGTETGTEDDSSERTEASSSTEAVSGNTGSSQTYTVRRGDTLVSISVRMYGTQKKAEDIKNANNIENGDRIYPGQKLVIPNS